MVGFCSVCGRHVLSLFVGCGLLEISALSLAFACVVAISFFRSLWWFAECDRLCASSVVMLVCAVLWDFGYGAWLLASRPCCPSTTPVLAVVIRVCLSACRKGALVVSCPRVTDFGPGCRHSLTAVADWHPPLGSSLAPAAPVSPTIPLTLL